MPYYINPIFEFNIKNIKSSTLTDINWSLNTSLDLISANELIDLKTDERIFTLIEYNYSPAGDYNVTASATDGLSAYEQTINITVQGG